jgi:hypothetical protein
MKAHEYILSKQTQWALNHGIKLIGSKEKRGRPAYTCELEQNLFEPMDPYVRQRFKQGDGNEIPEDSADNPAKMQAIHSSSALSVNVFYYWQEINQVPAIATACGFCQKGSAISQKIVFEDKYPIDNKFRFPPNIDVVFWNSESSQHKRYAVECKFTETYGSRRHSGLKAEYIGLSNVWQDIPALHEFAKSICPEDTTHHHLHVAQLIKHILGLKTGFGKVGFKLMYLWYDVLGEEGAVHRDEIERFSEIVQADGLSFHSLSYQELIIRLSTEFRKGHERYITYLTERYL